VVIPLFKSGDINNPSNYRIIMVNPLMGKLFWENDRAKNQQLGRKKGKKAKRDAIFRARTLSLTIVSPLDI